MISLDASEFGVAVLPAAFLVGLLGSVTSCCTPAVLVLMVGYSGSGESSGRRTTILTGAFFLLGTVVAVGALGAVAGFISQAAGAALGQYWKVFGGLLAAVFGLVLLNVTPFELPKIRLAAHPSAGGTIGDLLFGFAVGGTSAACVVSCNPLIAVPLGVAVLQGDTLWGAAILAAFAVGYSLPLAALLVGLRTGIVKLKKVWERAASVTKAVGGVLLIAAGFYLLATV